MFVLLAGLLCWFMFAPLYKHVYLVRHAVLQKEVDYLLEVGASGQYGYIDAAMIASSRTRLEAIGLDGGSLIYSVQATSGVVATDSAAPLLRGTGLRLTLEYPVGSLFAIDRLVGLEPIGPDTRIKASGMRMSEYLP